MRTTEEDMGKRNMSETMAVATLGTLGEVEELTVLAPSKAQAIRQVFMSMADRVQGFEADFEAITGEAAKAVTPELSVRARRLRLDIAKIRVEAEKCRKALKEEYLLGGRAVDGTNNVLKWAISQKENALAEIENHAALMEEERIARLQAEREDALAHYVDDIEGRDLGRMDGDLWDAYLDAKKRDHGARIEAERKVAEEREREERRRQIETTRLREIAPYTDYVGPETLEDPAGILDDEWTTIVKKAKEARAADEAERKARLAEAEKKRKAAEAEARKEQKAREEEAEKARAEAARIEAAHRAEREKAEKAEAARRAEDAQLAKDEAEHRKAEAQAARRAANAPDRERLHTWVASFVLPDLPGDDHEIAKQIRAEFCGHVADWIGRVDRELGP